MIYEENTPEFNLSRDIILLQSLIFDWSIDWLTVSQVKAANSQPPHSTV